jgi:hypothetical protein
MPTRNTEAFRPDSYRFKIYRQKVTETELISPTSFNDYTAFQKYIPTDGRMV